MSKNPEIRILDALKEKYDESFKMIEYVFSDEQNAYLFFAHPRKNQNIQFQGKFTDKLVEDSYPNHYFSDGIDEMMLEHIDNLLDTYAYDSEVISDYKHENGSKIISIEKFLEDESLDKTIHFYLYFFDVPDSAEHPYISHLKSIADHAGIISNHDFGMWTGFWPKGFLEGQNFDELTFGFNSVEMEDADNVMNKAQYLAKVISFDVKNTNTKEITEEDLFQIMGDYNFDKGYENKVF